MAEELIKVVNRIQYEVLTSVDHLHGNQQPLDSCGANNSRLCCLTHKQDFYSTHNIALAFVDIPSMSILAWR